jgi:hypothetical protein
VSKPSPALIKKIQDALLEAEDAAHDAAAEQGLPYQGKRRRTGNYAEPTEALKSILEDIYRDLRMLAESMGQRECLEQIKFFAI